MKMTMMGFILAVVVALVISSLVRDFFLSVVIAFAVGAIVTRFSPYTLYPTRVDEKKGDEVKVETGDFKRVPKVVNNSDWEPWRRIMTGVTAEGDQWDLDMSVRTDSAVQNTHSREKKK